MTDSSNEQKNQDTYPIPSGSTHSPLIYRIEVSLSIDGLVSTQYEARYVHERHEDGLRIPLGIPGPFRTLPFRDLDPEINQHLLLLPAPWSLTTSSAERCMPRRLDAQSFPNKMAIAACYVTPGQTQRYSKALRELIAAWSKEQERFFRKASKTAKRSWWRW